MIDIALTGSNGFIGGEIARRAAQRFGLRRIHRPGQTRPISPTDHIVDMNDPVGVAKALAGCKAIIHCAHDAQDEAGNLRRLITLLEASHRAGVSTVIVFGSFSAHDGFAPEINELGPSCPVLLPYVRGKQRLVEICQTYSSRQPKQRVIVLEPTIVEGEGGSWARFANHLRGYEQWFIPLGGQGLCNAISVEQVAEASLRCVSLPPLRNNEPNFERLVLSNKEPITWSTWLKRHAGLEENQLTPTSTRLLSANPLRNLLLSWKYIVGPAWGTREAFNLNHLTGSRFTQDAARGAPKEPHAHDPKIYTPEGLDRLTMFCIARANTRRAREFGILD